MLRRTTLKRTHGSSIVLMLAVLLGAFALRMAGIGVLLPQTIEPDPSLLTQAEYFARARDRSAISAISAISEIPWGRYSKYPHLLARILAFADTGTVSHEEPKGESLQDCLRSASAPIERGRSFIAVLAVLLVPITFLLGRRLVGSGPALVATVLVATDILHLTLSQQIRPHGPFATFAALSLLFTLRVRSHGRALDYVLAGVGVGLAMGSLHFGVFLIPPLVLAHLLRPDAIRRQTRWHWLLALLPVLIAVPVFYPFMFHSPPETVRRSVHWLGSHKFGSLSWRPQNLLIPFHLILRSSPILVLSGVLGFIVAARRFVDRRRRERTSWRDYRDVLVVLAFVVPFVFIVGGIMWSQTRFLVPLVCSLALLGAYGLWHSVRALTKRIAEHHRRRRVFVLGLLALLIVPTAVAIRCVVIQRRVDTLTLAASWITEHSVAGRDRIGDGNRVFLPIFSTRSGSSDPAHHDNVFRASWDHYQDAFRSRIPSEEVLSIDEMVPTSLADHDENDDEAPAVRGGEHDGAKEIASAATRLAASPDRYLLLARRSDSVDPYLIAAQRAGWRLSTSILATNPKWKLDLGDGYQDKDLFLRALLGTSWGPTIDILENPNIH